MIGPLDAQRLNQLIQAASEARQQAYAPYSNFAVGAALLTGGGNVYRGCNVENASFGLTLCAERTSAAAAISDGQREFVHLVLVTKNAVTPCGACRQFLAEFNRQLTITRVDADSMQVAGQSCLADLLPDAFTDFPSDA